MARLTATAFRLTKEDLAIMDEAKRRFGLASRVEALRYILRLWDGSVDVLRELHSKPVADSKPKRSRKKR